MRIILGAIGRQKRGPLEGLFNHYTDLIRSAGLSVGVTSFTLIQIDDRKSPPGAKGRDWQAHKLVQAAPKTATLIALDEKGRAMSSRSFAENIADKRDQGVQDLMFLIGGPDGHGRAVRDGAAETISLGPATWPHLLIRVMMAEQIYRAVSILSGHPYHRE